jgi:hypothetical protein
MDPQATWNELLKSYEIGNWDRAEELGVALLDWIDRRGSPPTTVGNQSLGIDLNRTIARFVCILLLTRIRKARRGS